MLIAPLLIASAAAVRPAPHWFVLDRPNGRATYLWGTKDARGYIAGTIPPAGSPELATVPRGRPPVNFGLDLGHRNPAGPGEVRGTDAGLGRELADGLAKSAEQCPGPGPCPLPRQPGPPAPDPAPVPDGPEGVRWLPLAISGGLGFLALITLFVFGTILAMGRRRP